MLPAVKPRGRTNLDAGASLLAGAALLGKGLTVGAGRLAGGTPLVLKAFIPAIVLALPANAGSGWLFPPTARLAP
jgi:hypothetical protein